jgi:hypothetical protein
MEFNPLFLMEFVLFSGVVLAWAAYEYWSVRPDKKSPDVVAPKEASPEDARHPEG